MYVVCGTCMHGNPTKLTYDYQITELYGQQYLIKTMFEFDKEH